MSEETQETRPVNGKSMYSYIADAWNVPSKSYVKDLNYERRIQWRKEEKGEGQEGILPEEGHRHR